MFQAIGVFILRYRITLLVCMALFTAFMAYEGRKAEVLQEFVKVIPEDDPEYQQYVTFKKQFGEDGNAVIVGLEGQNFFTVPVLNALYHLGAELDSLHGVERVLNVTRCYNLVRNDAAKRFDVVPVMRRQFTTQSQADSLKRKLLHLPFYKGLLFNDDQTASLLLINLDKATLTSKAKHQLIADIVKRVDDALVPLGIKTHFSGVPYIRSYISRKLPAELVLFMVLAILFTAVSLYVFYRSFYAVVFPLVLLATSTLCTFGLIGILGYKISLITALIPPIIVVLAIPPSIYMLSEYHTEFVKTGSKLRALAIMVRRLGIVTFMINANTAFGFVTLYFTNVVPLKEFGMLAFLATMLTYVLTIILIPGVFSLLPEPSSKRLRHLESPRINAAIDWMERVVINRRHVLYAITIGLSIISVLGMLRLQAVSYMVDDLPQRDEIYTDLGFMERNFKAVMPFEIMVDTKRKNGIRKLSTLQKMEEIQNVLYKYPEFSRSLSLVDAIKWSRQAFYDGDSSQYQLPTRDELVFLADYAQATRDGSTTGTLGQGNDRNRGILSNLVDSTYSKARITGFVKDVGSVRMPALLDSVKADLDSVFNAFDAGVVATARPTTEFHFVLTGTTKIFLKANDYLINNLFWSLVATFAINAALMWLLFGTVRVMIISLVPNLVPLAVTAGIMGFLDIPLKPSTALIYGIAFGIAIDNSIHYLTSYRHYRKAGLNVNEAVSKSLRTTGMSIMYTSAVLFFGFGIFIPSAFGSTRALGILTSVTMLIALFTNMLLLPALLLRFDKEKVVAHALIDEDDVEDGEVPTEAELK
jgi:predicted RND superfamily exporter protein